MNKGALVHSDYLELFKKNEIIKNNLDLNLIQPSSIDLTLSSEAYEINASFLSPKTKVRDRLKNFVIKKINLENKFIFKKNISYIVRLNEKLNLSENIFGKCNPKSSTGRIDVFCRTILDFSDEYEKIPIAYSGEIFIEITSRSFDLELKKNDSLNQMRLINKSSNYISDLSLKKIHKKTPIVFDEIGNVLDADISSGLKIAVDLNNKNKILAFTAKQNAPILKFNKLKFHKISDFWKKIKNKKNSIIIESKKFYILKSKQKIKIPQNMAGEMIPYDTGIGDFRVHYAGFFDPGFGDPQGSFAVLEVKTNEVPFVLEDGQVIARIKYEKLNKKSKVVYGSDIKSNYQNQGLALSKHFKLSKN